MKRKLEAWMLVNELGEPLPPTLAFGEEHHFIYRTQRDAECACLAGNKVVPVVIEWDAVEVTR